MEMFLRVRNGHVDAVRFLTDGCFFTIAACSAVAKMAENKDLRSCFSVNQSAVLRELVAMPSDHEHCAYLSACAFQRALRVYRDSNKTKKAS